MTFKNCHPVLQTADIFLFLSTTLSSSFPESISISVHHYIFRKSSPFPAVKAQYTRIRLNNLIASFSHQVCVQYMYIIYGVHSHFEPPIKLNWHNCHTACFVVPQRHRLWLLSTLFITHSFVWGSQHYVKRIYMSWNDGISTMCNGASSRLSEETSRNTLCSCFIHHFGSHLRNHHKHIHFIGPAYYFSAYHSMLHAIAGHKLYMYMYMY